MSLNTSLPMESHCLRSAGESVPVFVVGIVEGRSSLIQSTDVYSNFNKETIIFGREVILVGCWLCAADHCSTLCLQVLGQRFTKEHAEEQEAIRKEASVVIGRFDVQEAFLENAFQKDYMFQSCFIMFHMFHCQCQTPQW